MLDTLQQNQTDHESNQEDPQWKQLRNQVLQRDKHSCRNCGSSDKLHVHHKQYHRCKQTGEWKKPWEYHPIFLVTLCDKCHQLGHQQYSIPIRNI